METVIAVINDMSIEDWIFLTMALSLPFIRGWAVWVVAGIIFMSCRSHVFELWSLFALIQIIAMSIMAILYDKAEQKITRKFGAVVGNPL